MGTKHNNFNHKIIQQYIRDAKNYKPMDRKTEQLIIKKVQEGSRAALNRLINSNLLIVVKMAYNYTNQGLDFEDIVSAGNIGLIEAAKRIDPQKKNKFITYAVWWIRQSIRQAIFNQSRIVRLAANKEEKLKQFFKFGFPLQFYLGGIGINWEKLKAKFGKETDDIIPLLPFLQSPVQLDGQSIDGDHRCLADILPSRDKNPEEKLQDEEWRTDLQNAAKSLNPREQNIINEYFGLNNGAASSLSQIGEKFNLSKERVRQIKNQGLKKLHHILLKKHRLSFT